MSKTKHSNYNSPFHGEVFLYLDVPIIDSIIMIFVKGLQRSETSLGISRACDILFIQGEGAGGPKKCLFDDCKVGL